MLGVLFILYPFSDTLEYVGALPLVVFVAVLDGLFSAFRKARIFSIAVLTGFVGLLVFGWLWEMAGSPETVVLPVDLPEVHDAQFTSPGVTKTLVTAIFTDFPPRKAPLREPFDKSVIKKTSIKLKTEEQFVPSSWPLTNEMGSIDVFGGRGDILHDTPHQIGKADLGGVPLEPIYHALRHLRHGPAVEAQILIGGDPEHSLTLALRLSDIRPRCFSNELVGKLLDYEMKTKDNGKKALQELQKKVVEPDKDDKLKVDKSLAMECNPRTSRKLLMYLGVSGYPGELDERISNVTVTGLAPREAAEEMRDFRVVGLRPDEQLTQLIDRALLEGMGKVSPVLLGLYYDRLDRSDSALAYYEEALPQSVQQAIDEHGSARSRVRVARLLMRIADLEAKPKKGKDELGDYMEWEKIANEAHRNAERHFNSAIALVPEDARAHAHFGHFILHNTEEMLREGLLEPEEAIKNYKKAEDEFDRALELCSKELSDLEYSEELRTDLLIFSRKNRASALVAQAELQVQESDRSADEMVGAAAADIEQATDLIRAKDNLQGKAVDARKDPEEYDPDVLAVRGRILSIKSQQCSEVLKKFDRAFYIILNDWDLNRLLLLEEAYDRLAQKQECVTEENLGHDSLEFHRTLYQFAKARSYYLRGRYKESANALAEAEGYSEQVSASSPGFLAIFHGGRSSVLARQACDQEENLKKEDRGSLLLQSDSELSEAIVLTSLEAKGDKLDPDLSRLKSAQAERLAMSPNPSRPALNGALGNIRQAVKNEPDNVALKDRLGTVLLRLGELDEALKSYEEAARLDYFVDGSFDPEIHYRFGFALMQKGDNLRASDEWKFARSLDPRRWPYISNPLPGCGPIYGLADGRSPSRQANPSPSQGPKTGKKSNTK